MLVGGVLRSCGRGLTKQARYEGSAVVVSGG
jgi:hypothetical protein